MGASSTQRQAAIASRLSLTALLVGAILAGAMAGAGTASASGSTPYFTTLSAQMPASTVFPIMAALSNGQVLIAGGLSNGTVLQSAELYNPATETFTALPASGSTELQVPRFGAGVAVLQDGQVLIAGGNTTGDNPVASAELFDPATDTFTELPTSGSTELQDGRYAPVAAPLPNGQVLIAGGEDNNSAAIQSAELFDPTDDTFTALSPSGDTELQTPRRAAVAAPLPDGEVLIAGGASSQATIATQSAELFDPTTDTFTQLPASGDSEMSTPLTEGAAAPLPNGQVLIAGGYWNGFRRSAELFDPTTDTFTDLPASGDTELQTPRDGPSAAALPNGQVLIAGGSGDTSAELYYSAPQAAVAGGDFGDQTVGQPSATSTLIVTNVGAQTLRVAATALGGTNAGDFAITDDRCSGEQLGFDQSCPITTRFTPSISGPESATIALTDNEAAPTAIALSGTGVAANSGPTGTNGTDGTNGINGHNGAPGPPGPPGPAGQVELVTCKSVTTGKGKHKKTVQKCTTKLTSSPVKFTTSGRTALVASLARGKIVYAVGSAIRSHASTRLLLTARRSLVRGRYTLTLTHGRKRQRETITIL
jgi:hypothetical protein